MNGWSTRRRKQREAREMEKEMNGAERVIVLVAIKKVKV